MALNYSKGVDGMAVGIGADAGTLTAIQIDSAYTFETGGEAWFCRFTSPVSKTTGALTVYVHCSAVTGSPTYNVTVRNGAQAGQDVDRPEAGGSTLGTPGTAITPTANRWATFTLTSLTLVQGQTYFVIINNTSADPTTAYASWVYRGSADSNVGGPVAPHQALWAAGFTANGFTTDPTYGTGYGTCVVKFNAGEIRGFPWVAASANTVDTNDRGNKGQFDEDMVVAAIFFAGAGSGNIATIEITKVSDASVVLSHTLDVVTQNAVYGLGGAIPLTTLTGGVAYYIVLTYSGSTANPTRRYMGEADADLPADVLAAVPSWFLGWVGGATAPGSYGTPVVGLAQPMILILDDNPAIAGASGGQTTSIFGG